MNVIFRIIRALLSIGVIAILVFVGVFVFQVNRQSTLGKAWCENLIHDFEFNQQQFEQEYASEYRDGTLFLSPSNDYAGAMGNFVADKSGEYSCNYWHGGGIGPHRYTYSSRRKEWVYNE